MCNTSCGRGVDSFDYERNVAVVVNPFDIFEVPSCRIKESVAHQVFVMESAA